MVVVRVVDVKLCCRVIWLLWLLRVVGFRGVGVYMASKGCRGLGAIWLLRVVGLFNLFWGLQAYRAFRAFRAY